MSSLLKYKQPISSIKLIDKIEEIKKCPLCSSSKYCEIRDFKIDEIIDKWIEKRDINPIPDIYRHKKLIQKRCNNCGLYYYNYHLPDSTELYELLCQKNYYPKFRDEFLPAKNIIAKYKPKSLIELGCGCGNFLCYIKDLVPNSYGSETISKAIDLCKEKGVNVISSTTDIHNKFDIVCHFELMEHVFDINAFIANNIALLNQNGKIILGTPNPESVLSEINFDILDLPPHHQFLFSYKTFNWIAHQYKLRIINYQQTTLDAYRYEMYKSANSTKQSFEDLQNSLIGDTHVVVFEKI